MVEAVPKWTFHPQDLTKHCAYEVFFSFFFFKCMFHLSGASDLNVFPPSTYPHTNRNAKTTTLFLSFTHFFGEKMFFSYLTFQYEK